MEHSRHSPEVKEGEHTLLFSAAGMEPGDILDLLHIPAGYDVQPKGKPVLRADGLCQVCIIVTKNTP